MAKVIAAAKESGADAVHPGYGFLAERGDFAKACAEAGLTFVGPQVEKHLDLFGDKARARQAAAAASVPIIRGIDRACTLDDVKTFFASLGPDGAMIIKALAGGGGRGTRVVTSADEIEKTFERCRSEAKAAFGRDELYVEELVTRARHVEVQILGDRSGHIAHLSERECSVQRRFQKLLEIAPAPALDDGLRKKIIEAAVRLAKSVGYFNLGTFEFLVDVSGRKGAQPFAFIEANARLQVEHTVTEAVTGVDLVQTQIKLCAGRDVEVARARSRRSHSRRAAMPSRRASTWRRSRRTASVRPGGGTLTVYEAPTGPGVRTDGFGYAGYKTSSAFDSLLAKVIAHSPSPDFADAVSRLTRALSEFRLEGVTTNIAFLRNILSHPDFVKGAVHTRWLDEHTRDARRRHRAAPAFRAVGASRRPQRRPRRRECKSPRIRWRCSRTMRR